MIIDNLPTIPSTVTTGDELAVERGTTTYKIDYDALAAAILAQAVKKTGDTMTGSFIVDASASGNPRYQLYGANDRKWTVYRNDSTDLIYAQWGDGLSWRTPLWMEWETGKVRMASPLDVSQGGTGAINAAGARTNIGSGCPSGTFTTADGKTVTVTNGFITAIT
jgi:hypothetical protein